MKNLKYIAGTGTMMLLAGMNIVSCTDDNDWKTDSSYDRVFSVLEDKLSVSEEATTAEVQWTSVKGADYYVIEVSKDSLYNEVEIGGPNAVVYGQDKTVTESPFTLTGLTADTKYFLRIKAMSETKAESKWTYLDGYSFTTDTEQIFESVADADIDARQVTLHWEAGADVDYIEITDEKGTSVVKYTPTAEEKAAGTATLSGLEPKTDYTATIYKGDVKRGVVKFTTTAEVPNADVKYFLKADEVLSSDLLQSLKDEGNNTATIVLPESSSYIAPLNEDGEFESLVVPDGLSVTFFGMAGGNQPVMSFNGLNISGNHDYIKFENIELTGKWEGGSTNYLVNQSKDCNIGTFELSNCFLHDFGNTPFRLQKGGTEVVDNLIFTNCIVYNKPGAGYATVHVDANSGQGVVNKITFSKTTVVNASKNFIICKNTDLESIRLLDCTFSGIINGGTYFIDCGKDTYGPETIEITNCILGSTSAGVKGIRSKATINVTNSYKTQDVDFTGNKFDGLLDYDGKETDLFKDPKNFDFTIIDSSFKGKTSCGDPRWYMK